jgi:hypothetical protein
MLTEEEILELRRRFALLPPAEREEALKIAEGIIAKILARQAAIDATARELLADIDLSSLDVGD